MDVCDFVDFFLILGRRTGAEALQKGAVTKYELDCLTQYPVPLSFQERDWVFSETVQLILALFSLNS